MSLPKTYEDVATALGISPPWNWDERRVTRSGIRRFLMQAYDHPDLYKDPPWLRLWKQIEWTRTMCKKLHVVIPPELWAEDKARLAAKLVTSDIRNPEEKERALRWARR